MARNRGCLWLTAGVVVAILAGVVGFLVLSRAAGQSAGGGAVTAGRTVPVVVAGQAVPVGELLSAEMLKVRQVPVESTAEGAVGAVADAVGKVTMVDLYPGEVILAQRLADPNVISGAGRKALILSEGQVLMAFPASDLMSKAGVLKPGDHVDLLFSLKFPNQTAGAQAGENARLATFNLLQNVTIAALVGGKPATGSTSQGPPDALLLTIAPQDALVLKYVSDAGGTMDIVLRAPGDTGPYDTTPVDVDFMINRYKIPSGAGR
jgi:pilus assembly protein CpaB